MATESRKGKAFGLRHSELLTKCAALHVATAAAMPSVSASQLASNVVAAIRAALVAFNPALHSFFAANQRRLLCSVQRLAQTLHSQRNLTRSALSGGTEQYQTAGTRLVWSSLSEWLDAHRVLHNRPPSAAKYTAQRAHMEALPDALVLRATDADLDSLERRLVRGNIKPPEVVERNIRLMCGCGRRLIGRGVLRHNRSESERVLPTGAADANPQRTYVRT